MAGGPQQAKAKQAMPRLEQMFDPEVLAQLRETFDRADADGSGQIDAGEAVSLFASYCEPGASAAQMKRTASNLINTLDTDRSGRLSFEEFAFRFGRKLQMEVARRRREGVAPPSQAPARSAVCSGGGYHDEGSGSSSGVVGGKRKSSTHLDQQKPKIAKPSCSLQ